MNSTKKEKSIGYVECEKCNKWSDIPAGFKETRHFAKCPICKNAMFLSYSDPKEIALKDTNKVIAGLMLHDWK